MATGTFPFKSQFRLEAEAAGEAKGRSEDILRILVRRGIEIDDDTRARITSCTDLGTLGTWLDRSLTATAATDLFA